MKYAICVDKIKNNVLVNKTMRLICAPDPTILMDAVLLMTAVDNGLKKSQLATSKMPLTWYRENNENTGDSGCVKIRQIYVKEDSLYWILYYKKIRDHEVIRIKEEDYLD